METKASLEATRTRTPTVAAEEKARAEATPEAKVCCIPIS